MAELRIGAVLDPTSRERTDVATVLATADLTTHAVIVGMTGSGKTGLGVVLIEEVLAAGVPVLAIDPKGDLTNLCLTFPDLAPADFEPWVPPSDVASSGLSVADFAARQASTWRDGLAGWDVAPARLAALRAGVEFEVYTPGSSAGRPLNIVGSLAAPPPGTNAEDTADEIDGYVTSLLSMLGIDADPLTSREHVLLSSLIAQSWSAGRDLDLAGLLAQVGQPPMRKVGVLELEQFYPAADRAALVVRMNALLASPGFAAWMAGDPVDIDAMLRTPDGRPRCAVVTISHLSDEERGSVTALLLSKLLTWTRRQSGSADLRALLFIDEVAGYLPPTANPPTKKPILTLLKQARAFGVGVVLATQNPVDVDYKALSNAGTWLVGRLQTEQDKARLVDGLRSAAGAVDVRALSDAISTLGKRQFLLKRAATDVPALTTSRWAMSYLRGPLMRDEITRLATDGLVGPSPVPSPPAAGVDPMSDTAPIPVVPVPAATRAVPTGTVADDETPVAPTAASGIVVSYLDPAAPWRTAVGAGAGPRLEASAIVRVRMRFDDAKSGLVHDEEYEAVLHPLTANPDPAAFQAVDYDDRDLLTSPPADARYALPPADIARKAWWTALHRSLAAHLAATRTVEILANPSLRLYSRVGESPEEFRGRCSLAADERADAAVAGLRRTYETRLRAAETKAATAASAAGRAEARHDAEHGTGAQVATLLGGLFGGRRSRSAVLAQSRRRTASADRVEAALDKVSTAQRAIADIEADLEADVEAIDAQWSAKAADIQTLSVPLERSDVTLADLRLLWLPANPRM